MEENTEFGRRKRTKFEVQQPLSVYKMVYDPHKGHSLDYLAVTPDPAIEIKGVAFKNENPIEVAFKVMKEQQTIAGPAIIPDQQIFRENFGDLGDCKVFFDAPTIFNMVTDFKLDGKERSINFDHQDQMVNGIILHDWIVGDTKMDKSKFYGFNLPAGTWFVEMKILDKDFWNTDVKDLGATGFSIQGMMGTQLWQFNKDKKEETLDEMIDNLNDYQREKLMKEFLRDLLK
jgi:hypothetical protein